MFKFKMVNSPNCAVCNNVRETVKHLIWDCPRSARVWTFINELTRNLLGRDYVNYESVILGNPSPNMAMETIIVWTLKIITSINRVEIISNELIFKNFQTLFHYEKTTFGKDSKKMRARWGNLINIMI